MLYRAMTTARTTSQSPSARGRATLETMTTAQNRAVLDEAEARVDKAARARAQDPTPAPATPWDAPDDTTGSYVKEERGALRRVAGLSTELTDVTEVEYRQLRLERVVLVGVWTEGTAADADRSLAELAALAETAGSQVLDALVQRRDKPDAGHLRGLGQGRRAPRHRRRHRRRHRDLRRRADPRPAATSWRRSSRSRWSTGPR